MLALNASIEAAHARESSKGFAVVAEEIRKLAVKTQNALTELSDLNKTAAHGVGTGSFNFAAKTEGLFGKRQRPFSFDWN